MSTNKFSFGKRARSFKYAFDGITYFIRQEHNAWIHCFVLACVVVAGILLGISRMEWIVIAIVCGNVLAAEAVNTALEKLCDHVCPQEHPTIKRIKDMAAGAVLILTVVAVIVGLIVFLPRIVALFC